MFGLGDSFTSVSSYRKCIRAAGLAQSTSGRHSKSALVRLCSVRAGSPMKENRVDMRWMYFRKKEALKFESILSKIREEWPISHASARCKSRVSVICCNTIWQGDVLGLPRSFLSPRSRESESRRKHRRTSVQAIDCFLGLEDSNANEFTPYFSEHGISCCWKHQPVDRVPAIWDPP